MDKKTLREAQFKIGEARTFVEAVRDDAVETYDDKSDTWKESAIGESLQDQIERLTEAIDALETADSSIEQAMAD
jgi:hypothetical protein